MSKLTNVQFMGLIEEYHWHSLLHTRRFFILDRLLVLLFFRLFSLFALVTFPERFRLSPLFTTPRLCNLRMRVFIAVRIELSVLQK
jgi:hypothetical protein